MADRDYLAEINAIANNTVDQGYTPFGEIQQDVDWDELYKNDDWIKASQHFFHMTYGYTPLKGDKELEGYSGSTYREKLADYGLKQMAGFNFNLGDMTIDTARVLKADQQTKEAFVYMLDQYDATNTSWHTASQAGWEMFTDVTNWVGLLTLGGAAVAGQAGRLVGKQGLKQAVHASLAKASQKTAEQAAKIGIDTSVKRAAATAGVGASGHAMASDAMMQNVRIDAGQQEEYSYGQTAFMGSIGLAAGAGLGAGLDYGISRLARKYYDPKVKKAQDEIDQAQVDAQIEAERRLAEAREAAGNPVAKAVDNELPPEDINNIIKDQQERADAGDVPYYHGSFTDFDEFEIGISGNRYDGLQKREVESQGVFFSTDYDEANAYGNFVWETRLNLENTLKHPKDSPIEQQAKVKEDMEYIFEPLMEGGDVKYINALKNDGTLNKVKVEIDAEGKWIDQFFNEGRIDFQYADDPRLVSRMKERGYDSARVFELQSGTKESTIVFDPKKINKVKKRDAIRDPKPDPVKVQTVPRAALQRDAFKHAYNIFEDALSNPEGAAKRITEEFEISVPETNNLTELGEFYSNVKRQVNAAAQLARYNVDIINGKLLDDALTPAERTLLKGDLVKAHRAAEQLNIVKQNVNSFSGRDLEEIKRFLDIKETAAKDGGEKFDRAKLQKEAEAKVYNKNLKKMLEEHDIGIDKAIKEGNDVLARELRDAKVADINNEDGSIYKYLKFMESQYIEDTVTPKAKSSWDDKFLEAAISGVFSIPTLVYNTVYPAMKIAFFPMIDTLVNDPLNKMAWKKNLMIYSQMKGAMEAAWIAARASARYEQTILTADLSRILEGGVKINDIFGSAEAASYLRIFPRLVSASDAFQQELASVSTLTAVGMDKLLEEGLEKGLKGKALSKYIDDNIQTEINKGYDFTLSMQKMKPIYELGTRKGLAGKELEDFVDAEVAKFGDGAFKTLGDDVTVADMRKEVSRLLKEGTEESHNLANALAKEADQIEATGQEALNDVRTLLYKRDFNKKGGFAERLAAGYEDITRNRAWSRFIGNLFFRTPAWLFHESMRLTPAVNQLLPQFRNDLSGVNGVRAQTRAKTEASMAYAWTLYVVTKYAMGEISGSANVDYTKTAEKNQSSMRPLTIKEPFFFENGEEVNFARFEPLRIPTTIIVNSLDGYMDYQEQLNMDGIDPEKLNGTVPDEFMAALGVAFATAISAFRDSALTQGITDTVGTAVKVSGLMESPEGEDKEKGMNLIGNFFLDKSLQMIPSSFKKMNEAIRGDAPIVQPKTLKHKLISSVNPYSPNLPLRFDAVGFPMEREVTYTQITGFGAAYPEDLANGRSKEHMEVLDYLAKLESLNFGNFTRQKTRDDRFPNKDLRTIDVNYEGQNTVLFNVMMHEMYKIPWLIPRLHRLANSTTLDLGSPLNKHTLGERVKQTRAVLTEARNLALDRAIRITGLSGEVRQRENYERMLKYGQSTNRENISLFE